MDKRSGFFIQFSCEETLEQTKLKYEQLSLVSCIFCFVCAVYSLAIYLMKVRTNISVKMIDLETVTAGDFTVEVELTEKMIEKFKNDEKWKNLIEDK